MAITEIGIANSALIKIGCEELTSFDDDLKAARLCKLQYPKIRDLVLEAYPWTFAQKRAVLAQLNAVPAWGFTLQYQLPSDYYRLTEVDGEFEHVIESGLFLTDNGTVKIKYTALVTDPGKFTPTFAEAVATALAADLAYSLVQSAELAKLMNDKYEKMLGAARSSNAQGRGSARNPEVSEFLRSRL